MKTSIKLLFTIMMMVFLNASLYATEVIANDSVVKTDKVDSKSKQTQVYIDYIDSLDKKYESKRNLFSYVTKLLSINMDKNIDVEINSVAKKSVLATQDQKSQSNNMTIVARKTIFEW